MKKFPYWIIPLLLLVFILVIIIILSATGQLPVSEGYFTFLKKSELKKNSWDEDYKDKRDYGKTELLKKNDSDKIELPYREKVFKRDKKHDRMHDLYADGLISFSKGDYHHSSWCFLNIIKESSERGIENKSRLFKSKFYLAYSLMFLGIKNTNEDLLEKSKRRFIDLYKQTRSKQEINPRIVLGIAKTSRFLENYPEGIDLVIKENLMWASHNIKKHLYLELGYYYFYENKLDLAITYYEKSALPIANQKFYELLLERDGVSITLFSLLSKNLIPKNIYHSLKPSIQKRMLQDARSYFKNNQKEEAYYILKKMLTSFHHDYVNELAGFYLAEFYKEDGQFQKALYYYDYTLSNEFLEYDAASLFKKGVIYYKLGNLNDAIKNFNLVRENFVSSKYYHPAMEWLKEIQKGITGKDKLKERDIDEEIIQPENKKTTEKSDDIFDDKDDKELLEDKKITDTKKDSEIEKKIIKDSKESDSLEDELFLKEEIPEEEIY